MTAKRSRRKHTVSFSQRLQRAATAARDAARALPAGEERDLLLKKAQEAETAKYINELLSMPLCRPQTAHAPIPQPTAYHGRVSRRA